MVNENSSVKEIVSEHIAAAGKKELTCAKVMELSKIHNVPLKEIKKYCDEEGIKLKDCQLGCF